MYSPATQQEQDHKGFFYPVEDMGTTIMAIKYDSGVIACADSRTTHITKALQQEDSTSLTELQIKLTLFTTQSSFSGVEQLVSHSKLPTKYDS